jgi:hypothetical protein
MKLATTLIAAIFVAGSATLALAPIRRSAVSGAGSDLSTPRQSMQRPTPRQPAGQPSR